MAPSYVNKNTIQVNKRKYGFHLTYKHIKCTQWKNKIIGTF